MQIPMIQIRTTPMKLGMRTSPPELSIEQGNPITLELQTKPGRLEMHTEHVKVHIDQSKCFEECGFMSNTSLIEDAASYARQKALEGIGNTVEQGNQFAAIENRQDPIPEQAEQNAFDQFIRDWTIGSIPRSRPEFKVTGGTVDIQYRPAEVINNTQKSRPNIQYNKGKLDVYVEQYNAIEFSVLDLKG